MSKKAIVNVGAQILPKVSTSLRAAGFHLTNVDDAMDALAILEKKEYDLLVFEANTSISYQGCIEKVQLLSSAPILALVDADDYTQAEGVFSLVDDALLVDFDPKELTVRARALKKHPNAPWNDRDRLDTRFFYGDLCISILKRDVLFKRMPIKMTKTEFKIFRLLASNPEQVFSCRQIYTNVWNEYTDIEVDGIIRSHIQHIRKKLEKATQLSYICAKWGFGYYFDPFPQKRKAR